ncbi:Cytochrome c oxidase assembly factor 6 [Hypsizygus marmoreus]|uniref:Cytochrome c oxidase assembly factor 6 n=1 Tax=Hypsizygus marmoreus TaxID=39966 RepID=A0A369JTE3_HYPMA|nr:Cytochrome c oxidase assembly factor 6 [Hypsizygus marmoreus]
MGWLSGSSKSDEATASSRQDRKKCWEARDAYFSCLDRVGVVKAGQEGKACSTELRKYEDNCAKSWIEYFNQRRSSEASDPTIPFVVKHHHTPYLHNP